MTHPILIYPLHPLLSYVTFYNFIALLTILGIEAMFFASLFPRVLPHQSLDCLYQLLRCRIRISLHLKQVIQITAVSQSIR